MKKTMLPKNKIIKIAVTIVVILILLYGGASVLAYSVQREVADYPAVIHQQLKEVGGQYVNYADIPDCLKNGIVSVEDERFFEHSGLDPLGLARAIKENLLSGSADEGGSTITQQLTRRIFRDKEKQPVNTERTLESKLQIIRYSLAVEQVFSKEQILEMYVNQVYYGRRAQGAAQAAQAYFAKDLSKLTSGECTFLAGVPQAPTAFGNDSTGSGAQSRRQHVLETMVRNKYLTQGQADAAGKENLHFK